jgi:hypothetical protein
LISSVVNSLPSRFFAIISTILITITIPFYII